MPQPRAHQPPTADPSAPAERSRVLSHDGVWLQDSINNPMIINAVYILDRLDVGTLRRVFRERILEAGGGERYDRFAKRVVSVHGRYYWEKDGEFDVARHIVAVERPDVGDELDLERYLGEVAAQPLPGDRPLWQLQLLDLGEGTSALVCRLHHCLGDGIALVPVLFELVDPHPPDHPEPGEDGSETAEGVERGKVAETAKAGYGRFSVKAAAALAGPYVLVEKALRRKDDNVLRGEVLSGSKRVAWSPPLEVERVKAVKNALGATVNDVLMTAVAGAVHHYDQLHGAGELGSVRASMPVNIRPPGEPYRMENRFAAVFLELPVGVDDPLARLREIKRRTDRLKRSVEPLVMFGAASLLLKVLPQALSKPIIDFYANKCTCVLTNVPGPQEPLYLAGRRLRHLMFWVPQRADIGVGISIVSFSGWVRVGVITDAALVPDPQTLVDGFVREFDALAAVAGL
jgi:diacylglycerol O-acyltransferase / wax synthase